MNFGKNLFDHVGKSLKDLKKNIGDVEVTKNPKATSITKTTTTVTKGK